MRSIELPSMKNPGAYDRLRELQRARRWAQRISLTLLALNLVALGVYVLMSEHGRYWFGG